MINNTKRLTIELPVRRAFFPHCLLVSTALLGTFTALAAPAHAAPHHSSSAPLVNTHASTIHLAHLRAAQVRAAAHGARLNTALAASRVAQALHAAHIARQAARVSLRGRTAQVKLAEAKLMHARKMALLKTALHEQHLALAEVKMQRTLTAKANKMAQRQMKLAQGDRKSQMRLAALRHQSLMRLGKLQTQHMAMTGGNVVMAAYSLRGSRYVMGGTSRSGFDCSGFVRYVLSTTDGVSIPRTAAQQYYHGLPIPVGKMEPGDLVFFKNTYKHGISHVGIYAGQGKFIHAANSHKGVRMDILNSPYYWSHFAGARRVLPSVMREAAFLR